MTTQSHPHLAAMRAHTDDVRVSCRARATGAPAEVRFGFNRTARWDVRIGRWRTSGTEPRLTTRERILL